MVALNADSVKQKVFAYKVLFSLFSVIGNVVSGSQKVSKIGEIRISVLQRRERE